MKTKIFSQKQIKRAAQLIKKGEVVAFPTETVYGLGANALDPNAVKKIFIAKGRPLDNPLIVHIAKKEQLGDVAEISAAQKKLVDRLIKKFWPGPLTLILKKKNAIPKEVTAGLKTVAVRMPKNKIALDLIKHSGTPIAAPSANISGKPSGTCFEDVLDDFNGKIAGIIKYKECNIGLESTVLDLTTKAPVILRPGGTTYESLKKIIPKLKIACSKSKRPKSPGMKYRHYAPNAKVILFEKTALSKIGPFKEKLKKHNKNFLLLRPDKIKNFHKMMFKVFRDCDKKGINYILVSAVEEKGINLAVMNRLRKSAFRIIK
ncbi:MAG: L-threonylcarbamoyladenylate synthase [Candidatus Woesearchaeota archaeon]|nr:L-threonylcarbamoyladenylate synthase [Candidatus Woesearchaeota archaeon]